MIVEPLCILVINIYLRIDQFKVRMVFTFELPSFMAFSGPKLGPKINIIELRVTFRTNPDIYISVLLYYWMKRDT